MARLFNGTSNRIDLANETNFDFERTQAFSIAGWVYVTANISNGAICAKQTTSALGWFLGTENTGGPRLAGQIASPPGQVYAESVGVLSLNVWQHVVLTYDGSSTVAGLLLYINGVSQAKTNTVETLAASILNNEPVQLGGRGGTVAPDTFFSGGESGFGIWNVVLTQSNITTLNTAADPLGVQNANLIAYLPLCGVDSPEPDRKGTNNGTLTGTIRSENPRFAPWCQEQTDIGLLGRGAGW